MQTTQQKCLLELEIPQILLTPKPKPNTTSTFFIEDLKANTNKIPSITYGSKYSTTLATTANITINNKAVYYLVPPLPRTTNHQNNPIITRFNSIGNNHVSTNYSIEDAWHIFTFDVFLMLSNGINHIRKTQEHLTLYAFPELYNHALPKNPLNPNYTLKTQTPYQKLIATNITNIPPPTPFLVELRYNNYNKESESESQEYKEITHYLNSLNQHLQTELINLFHTFLLITIPHFCPPNYTNITSINTINTIKNKIPPKTTTNILHL